MLIHCEESATTKTARFRRNPMGAGGPPTFQTEAAGAPQALSFVGHDEKTSFRSSLRACNPKTPARGPRDFCHGLLSHLILSPVIGLGKPIHEPQLFDVRAVGLGDTHSEFIRINAAGALAPAALQVWSITPRY